jgi:hypothetical protein
MASRGIVVALGVDVAVGTTAVEVMVGVGASGENRGVTIGSCSGVGDVQADVRRSRRQTNVANFLDNKTSPFTVVHSDIIWQMRQNTIGSVFATDDVLEVPMWLLRRDN